MVRHAHVAGTATGCAGSRLRMFVCQRFIKCSCCSGAMILAAARPKRPVVPRLCLVAAQRITATMLLVVVATIANAALQMATSHRIPSFLLMIRQASKRKFSPWLTRQSLALTHNFWRRVSASGIRKPHLFDGATKMRPSIAIYVLILKSTA